MTHRAVRRSSYWATCLSSLALLVAAGKPIPAAPQTAVAVTYPAAPAARAKTITTIDRAREALQIAKMAANNGMQELSLRAVKEVLSAGPPIQPIKISRNQINVNSNQSNDRFTTEIETAVSGLNTNWEKHKFEPKAVYETLSVVVFPASRPNEIFMYPRTLSGSGSTVKSQSLGELLLAWAEKAGAMDDLRNKLTARMAQPRAKVECLTLLSKLEIRAKKFAKASEYLGQLREAVRTNTLQHAANIAAHAAIDGIGNKKTAAESLPVLEQVADNLAASSTRNTSTEPVCSLLMMVANARIEAGDTKIAEQHLSRYLQIQQLQNNRYSGDYGMYRRKQQLSTVALAMARAGNVKKSLDYLGQAADIVTTRYSSTGTSTPLAVLRSLANGTAGITSELREWCMPKKGRKSIRHLFALGTDKAPPTSFAKVANSEAPDLAFRMDLVGNTPNLMSTAAIIVADAKKSGDLPALVTDLEKYAKDKVENALPMYVMALAAAGEKSAKLANAAKQLQDKLRHKNTGRNRDYALDCAALAFLATSDLPLAKKNSLLNATYSKLTSYNNDLLSTYHSIRATTLRHHNRADDELFARAAPAMWLAAASSANSYADKRCAQSVWLVQDNMFSHAVGADCDRLFLRSPLTGTFTIDFESLDDGWAEGEVAFGGLLFQSHSHNNRQTVFGEGIGNKTHGAIYRNDELNWRGQFVRQSVRVKDNVATWYVNGHKVFQDKHASGSSPWFALASEFFRNAKWRNVTISGDPQIPAQVSLSNDQQMRGWASGFLGRTRPHVINKRENWKGNNNKQKNVDWKWDDGRIVGKISSGGHNLLQYTRPLGDGEQIAWEFQRDAEHLVNPALDRLVFLIDQDKLRLRWVTTSDDWTGLVPRNSVVEENILRGNKSIPLKKGWNTGRLAREGNTIRLSINDQTVAERTMESTNNMVFGLYHSQKHTASVRNIVLSGNWPTDSNELLAGLTKSRGELTPDDRLAINSIIEEKRYALNAIDVVRRARTMEPDKAYDYLLNWVMPGETHSQLRAYGDLQPVLNAPPLNAAYGKTESGGKHRLDTGGKVVSPLGELIVLAKKTGRTQEIRKQLSSVKGGINNNARSQLAAFVLLELSEGNAKAAAAHMNALDALVIEPRNFQKHERWAEVIACDEAVEYPETRNAAMRILRRMIVKQIQSGKEGDYAWAQHVRHILAKWSQRELLAAGLAANKFNAIPNFTLSTELQSESVGRGLPAASYYVSSAGELNHSPGHGDDFAYFQSPITGDFEMECELRSFDYRESEFGYAGVIPGLQYSLDKVRVDNLFRNASIKKLDKKIDVDQWFKFRMVVKDNTMTCYTDGQQTYQADISEKHDPWLFWRSYRWCSSGVRNLKFSGKPRIPKTISLVHDEQLIGWNARYFKESIGPGDKDANRNNNWARTAKYNGIVGAKRLGTAKKESVVFYHRPVSEDGELSWRFGYEAGKTEIHPALDRLVFLLKPDGVRIHWLTAGRFERSDLAFDNEFVEADNQLSKALKFKKQKNEMTMKIVGDTVTLILNGEPIYRRELEKDNQRHFGLFHYTDTRASAGSLRWTGNWPKSLPDFSDASYAQDPVQNLLAKVKDLPQKRIHNLPDDFTNKKLWSGRRNLIQPTENGVKMISPAKSGWTPTAMHTQFGVRGDFDIVAEFQKPTLPKPTTESRGRISFELKDDSKTQVWWGPINKKNEGPELRFAHTIKHSDGKSTYPYRPTKNQETGRLRIVRIGAEVWFLVSDKAGSDNYRIVESAILGTADIPYGSLKLDILSGSNTEVAEIEWTKFEVKATELFQRGK